MEYKQSTLGERRTYLTPSLRTVPVQYAQSLLAGSMTLPDIEETDEIDW